MKIKYVYDIETLACMFDAGFYDYENNKWEEFEISERKNDLYPFIKFYNTKNISEVVGYNNLSFDSQVLEFITKEYEKWFDLNGLEIAGKIYEFTQKLIENQKYMFYRPYKNITVNQTDCFTILGLDNAARSSSLKKCQFQLDYPNVEDMPIHHGVLSLTDDEKDTVISYRRNDVLSTLEVYKLILGETEQKVYKGKNQLVLRENIETEFGLKCKNYSDIKIGDELLKMQYAKEKKIPVNELPKKGTFRKWVHFSKGIPDYIEFKTEKLQKVLEEMKLEKVSAYVKRHDRKITLKGTTHVIGLGGIHSTNKGEIYKADDNHYLIDLDVGSMYPAIICNQEYYPAHLGTLLLKVYNSLFKQRIKLKNKENKSFSDKVTIEGIKLILNSFYGKMGSIDSWAYDKQVQVNVCLTGQLSLLMLIEEMELNGIICFMSNTDGGTFKVPKDKLDKFKEIWEWWENKTDLILEESRFKAMYFSNVNNYIAIKEDGEIKQKGRFIVNHELWKNKSRRVIALALEEYFINGKNIEDFIKNHKNIYDFCILARAKGNFKIYIEKQGEEPKLQAKLLRYFVSNNPEKKILVKSGINSSGKQSRINFEAENELGKNYITVFNKYNEIDNYNINYDYYVLTAYDIIDEIEGTKRRQRYIESIHQKDQIKLF